MKIFPATRRRIKPGAAAFSLLEVMIAVGIFFVATFSILELTSRNLKQARSLQQWPVDPSSLAAELSLTNILVEGGESGDFGRLYPGVSWSRDVVQVATNGLFQVDFVVHWALDKRPMESRMSVLMFRPDSPAATTHR